MTLRLGSKLGRFEITGVLGEGAMGTVYLAHDPQIERPVAIKTLRLGIGGDRGEEIANRFQKEAKLAGRLQHPNIVTIYEAGRDQGVDFIAMEYIDGEPLNNMLSRSGFSAAEGGSRPAGRPGARACPREGSAPPGYQAGKHPHHARRARESGGLRHRQAYSGRRPDAHGSDDRKPGLHVARADSRREARREKRLLPSASSSTSW